MDNESKIKNYKIIIIILAVITSVLAIILGMNYDIIVKYHSIMQAQKERAERYRNYNSYNHSYSSYNYYRNISQYKYGLIDKNGNLISKKLFDQVGYSSFGYPSIYKNSFLPVRVNDKWGYLDKTGKFVIKPKFDNAESFQGEIAKVQQNGKWGIIDINGKFLIKPKFDNIDRFYNGLARVQVDQKWGIINKNGKYIIEPKFDELGYIYSTPRFNKICLPAKVNDKWGIIDLSGKYLIKPKFDILVNSYGDWIKVKVNNKWGYIDKSGKYIIEPKFDEINESYGYNLLSVEVNNKWGCIDKTGKYIIKPKFDFPISFLGEIGIVRYRQESSYNHSQTTEKKPEKSAALINLNLPKNFEIHAVSGYEPQKNLTTKVVVDRPHKNVVLILSAYDKINWEVTATPFTKIVHIITGGYNKSYVDANKNIPVSNDRLPYACQTENINFRQLLKYIEANLGKRKIDSYTGSYSLPGIVNVRRIDPNVKLSLDYPKAQKNQSNIKFKLVNYNGSEVELSPNGPINGSFYPPESRNLAKNHLA